MSRNSSLARLQSALRQDYFVHGRAQHTLGSQPYYCKAMDAELPELGLQGLIELIDQTPESNQSGWVPGTFWAHHTFGSWAMGRQLDGNFLLQSPAHLVEWLMAFARKNRCGPAASSLHAVLYTWGARRCLDPSRDLWSCVWFDLGVEPSFSKDHPARSFTAQPPATSRSSSTRTRGHEPWNAWHSTLMGEAAHGAGHAAFWIARYRQPLGTAAASSPNQIPPFNGCQAPPEAVRKDSGELLSRALLHCLGGPSSQHEDGCASGVFHSHYISAIPVRSLRVGRWPELCTLEASLPARFATTCFTMMVMVDDRDTHLGDTGRYTDKQKRAIPFSCLELGNNLSQTLDAACVYGLSHHRARWDPGLARNGSDSFAVCAPYARQRNAARFRACLDATSDFHFARHSDRSVDAASFRQAHCSNALRLWTTGHGHNHGHDAQASSKIEESVCKSRPDCFLQDGGCSFDFPRTSPRKR